jgi:hypothetical protein
MTRFHQRWIGRAFVAGLLLGMGGTLLAQPQPAPTAPPACAQAALTPHQLYGEWTLLLWPLDGAAEQSQQGGTVRFEPHPEYGDSVRGKLSRPGSASALLSGDAVDGDFVLDESEDGVAISAVWHAVVNPADCGRRIEGTRRPAEGRPADEATLNFRLSKPPGWQ